MDWAVERIIIGDGSADNSNIHLSHGKLYASARLHGGNEQFYPIDSRTLTVTPYSLQVISSNSEGTPDEPITTVRKLLKWLKQHKGTAVTVGGIGARSGIKSFRGFQIREFGRTFSQGNQDSCVSNALINAYDCLLGSEMASLVARHVNNHPFKISCLRQLHKIIVEISFFILNPKKVVIKKVDKEFIPKFNEDRFGWVANLKEGIWMLRVVQLDKADHCVCIDANRGIVLDSAAPYPFILVQDLLTKLGGDSATKLEVAEIRQLQTVLKRSRTEKPRHKKMEIRKT